MRYLFALLAFALPTEIHAQTRNSTAACESARPVAESGAFALVEGHGIVLSTFESSNPLPISQPEIRVCIPVDLSRAPYGAVNIRFQIYNNATAPIKRSQSVEYESDTAAYSRRLRDRERGDQSLPSVGIQTYQNYHGCNGDDRSRLRRNIALYNEFHVAMERGNRTERSDSPAYLSNFLFDRDVREVCNTVSAGVAGLFDNFSIGLSQALGFSSANVEKIVYRRSMNVRYDFRNSDTAVPYVSYVLKPLEPNRCVRIAVSNIYLKGSSQIVGYACSRDDIRAVR
jgi:hypothetical protein